MKLELKHLAPYLPYGLNCEILDYKSDYVGEKYLIMKGYYLLNNQPYFNFHNGRDYAGKNTTNFKPILRPLSDLEECIFIESVSDFNIRLVDEFENIIDGWCEDYDEWWNSKYPNYLEMMNSCPYEVMVKLLEWHFDVFGLIPKGLAIDKNTLK